MDGEERSLGAIERDLQRFHVSLGSEFRKAERLIGGRLSRANLATWATEGVAIAQNSFRSWEAASEYFGATPAVLDKLSFPQFLTWARWGRTLAQDSPNLAAAFFRAGPGSLDSLAPAQVSDWAELGRGLYKGTWKSSALACRFFEQSPRLLRYLPLPEMRRYAAFTDALAARSYDMAAECMALAEGVLSKIDQEDRDGFLGFTMSLVETSWRDARAAFETGGRVLARVSKPERGRFLSMAEALARVEQGAALVFFNECSRALAQMDPALHGEVMDLADQLMETAPATVPEFLRNAPRVLKRIRAERLGRWFQEGARILAENPEGGLAYFRLESTRGEEVLEGLASGVELERVREILRMYCRALAGTGVELSPANDLKAKGIGWAAQESPTTEGNTIYLPGVVERYPLKDQNFGWYKVVSTHQVAHLEFGSFEFSFNREAALFPESRRKTLAARSQDGHADAGELARFFDLFDDRRLAADIFTALEDTRIDSLVKREYAGIRESYRRVQRDALAERADIAELPLREALVEYLVRVSLDDGASAEQFPSDVGQVLEAIGQTTSTLRGPEARVEDTAEATIRLYELIRAVPNAPQRQENEDMQPSAGASGGAPQPRQSGQPAPDQPPSGDGQGPRQQGGQKGRQEESPYTSPRRVEYRGDFKPELVQLLSKLRTTHPQQGKTEGQQRLSQALQQFLEKSVEFEMDDAAEGQVEGMQRQFVENLLNEAARQRKARQDEAKGFGLDKSEDDGNSLSVHEPLTFLYSEWDFRAGDYKPRWCCVRERRMEEGGEDFFQRTLDSYSSLVNQIKRSFEMVSMERLRKLRFLTDGEDLELDAVIEARVEQKAGATPTDKIYWRRNKVERDVAVAFLLDMSASTAEAIDESRRSTDKLDPPDDPRDYMAWLKSRREDVGRPTYKRIIDIEKESTVLLIKALETVGDRYGIYGFSGYGRENVEFFVIKDLPEAFSDRVKRRIDKIAPLHATRMGPAIRHVVTKLDQEDAKTKILFLISDGRPQDRGYSREGVEREYAVHDTKMALTEARRRNIVPFCLTVDRSGHDYLKTMCSDMGYEVLADIQMLPKRLPFLYRRLTV